MFAQYVIETFPMQESLASREGTKAGFDCTWLSVREELRTRHGRRIIITSLFPSYIFFAFDPNNDNWKRIPRLRGVSRILGSTPDKPQPLPPGTLEAIKARFLADEFKVTTKKENAPAPSAPKAIIRNGDLVLINVGLEEPKLGICKMSTKERVRVLMEYMGGEREAEFTADRVSLSPDQNLQTTLITTRTLSQRELTAHRIP